MLPRVAPIAAKAHRPSIVRTSLPVSARRAGTICTVMLNLFDRLDEEDGQAGLRCDFGNGEVRYDCNSPTERSGTCNQSLKPRRSRILAATNASPISSAEAVANRNRHIRDALVQCSGEKSSGDPADAIWPSNASNLFGIVGNGLTLFATKIRCGRPWTKSSKAPWTNALASKHQSGAAHLLSIRR
jgi:hypothetical protein